MSDYLVGAWFTWFVLSYMTILSRHRSSFNKYIFYIKSICIFFNKSYLSIKVLVLKWEGRHWSAESGMLKLAHNTCFFSLKRWMLLDSLHEAQVNVLFVSHASSVPQSQLHAPKAHSGPDRSRWTCVMDVTFVVVCLKWNCDFKEGHGNRQCKMESWKHLIRLHTQHTAFVVFWKLSKFEFQIQEGRQMLCRTTRVWQLAIGLSRNTPDRKDFVVGVRGKLMC